MSNILVNRVAKSGIVTLNLEEYYPDTEFIIFDIKDYLFKEFILKEKDFRQALNEYDWSGCDAKTLLIYCSNDAIVPIWAYMLVASHAEAYAKESYVGDQEMYLNHYYQVKINSLDISEYTDKRIVIKGCSNKPVPSGAYQELTRRLKPIALSIMFGEPCSMVPIYKKPKNK